MSIEINNREYRQETLKGLIEELHNGKTVDEVKGRFEAAFSGVSAEEIALAEQALIANGLPVSEVQRLCDVHAAVFKGSIEEIHRPSDPAHILGHPVNTLMRENRAVEKLVEEIRGTLAFLSDAETDAAVQNGLKRLFELDRHYSKKENLLFPYMEQYGITAPPKVMWGVDDEIRGELKAIVAECVKDGAEANKARIEALLKKIDDMIFKEENIMLPMLLENLTQDEWLRVAKDSAEIGWCLILSVPVWEPAAEHKREAQEQSPAQDGISLPTGSFTAPELTALLNTLPFDITFVDKNDRVKYFSQGAERIFPRTSTVLGRDVSNCHPPASVHIVEKLVEDFRSGKKDSEDFWIQMGGRFVLIRYFALRGENGEYLGVLEATQNIRPLQNLTGEKRLVTE